MNAQWELGDWLPATMEQYRDLLKLPPGHNGWKLSHSPSVNITQGGDLGEQVSRRHRGGLDDPNRLNKTDKCAIPAALYNQS